MTDKPESISVPRDDLVRLPGGMMAGIPRRPNFISLFNEKASSTFGLHTQAGKVSVKALSSEQRRAIAEAWTEVFCAENEEPTRP